MSPTASTSRDYDREIAAEAFVQVRRVMVLSDPHFHEGNRIGLEQEKAGLVVSYEELRAKYGRR